MKYNLLIYNRKLNQMYKEINKFKKKILPFFFDNIKCYYILVFLNFNQKFIYELYSSSSILATPSPVLS